MNNTTKLRSNGKMQFNNGGRKTRVQYWQTIQYQSIGLGRQKLMKQLDAADREGIQRGCARYVADLQKTRERSQGTFKPAAKHQIKRTHPPATGGPKGRPYYLKFAPKAAGSRKTVSSIAPKTVGRRSKRLRHLSNLSSIALPQGVTKTHGSRRSARHAPGRGGNIENC